MQDEGVFSLVHVSSHQVLGRQRWSATLSLLCSHGDQLGMSSWNETLQHCFASHKDGPPSSISLPVRDPPHLPEMLHRIHPAPAVVGLLVGEQGITSARFSFHLQQPCSRGVDARGMFAESPTHLLLWFSLFFTPLYFFFHEEGGVSLQLQQNKAVSSN